MMTPTELLQNEIARFLKSRDAEVLCISGEWGVGKTFTWQTMLDKATASKILGLKRYAYISLFGINSLEELKLTVFENSEFLLPKESADTSAHVKKWGNKVLSLFQKSRTVAEEVPWIGEAIKGAGPLFFSAVRNQIVCIDDLERRGSDLDVKDVLGLVSFLKEQRKCKVVVLLNDKELGDDGKVQFTNHFEKVIDVHMRFAPEPKDSVRIALPGTDVASRMLGDHCKSLGISNIRVIKRIERIVRMVEPLLDKFDDQVLKQAIHSLTLLGWSKFQPTVAPSLDYLNTKKGKDFFGLKNDEDMPPEEAAWNALLDDYGFTWMDEFDLELLKTLENGICDPAAINKQAAELDAKCQLQRENGSFEDAWRGYHDSFADNRDEVLNTIYASFKRTVQGISPINLNGTVSLFRELGRDAQAEEVIEFYIDHRNEDREFWDLAEYPFADNVTDCRVIKAFADKLASFKYEIDPTATLLKIAINKSWEECEITALAATPVDTYYNIFKTQNGKDLSRIIAAALQFDRISNASAPQREIAQRAKDALIKIGEESDINARRVRKYGIVVGNPTSTTTPPLGAAYVATKSDAGA